MKVKAAIIFLTLALTALIVSGGYGYWQEDLTIKGSITAVSPKSAGVEVNK